MKKSLGDAVMTFPVFRHYGEEIKKWLFNLK